MEVVFVEAELPAKSPSHDIPVVTMLDWEFYVLNATTTLLWLCQTVDHLVLVGLISLGAVCVLVSLCVLAGSLVRLSFSISRTVFSTLFDISDPGDVLPPVSSWTSSYVLRPGQGLCDPSDILGGAALARLPPPDDSLSLSQSLALNPDQWPELPARSSVQVNDPSFPPHSVGSHEQRSALRRSRRQQRARTIDSL